LNETKLKGRGKSIMGSIKGVKSGVGERCCTKEGKHGEGVEVIIIMHCLDPTGMWELKVCNSENTGV
jgi:hypothetical protein